MHRGDPVNIEGVPYGETYEDGDYYIADAPLAPKDIDLERHIDLLEDLIMHLKARLQLDEEEDD